MFCLLIKINTVPGTFSVHYIILQVNARPECCVWGRIKEVEEEEEGEGGRDITSFTDLLDYQHTLG